MPSVNELVEEIRGRLGDPSEAELPEPQIVIAVEGALREFSRYRPDRSEVVIDLVPGTYEYPLPVGTTEVSEHALSPVSPAVLGFELERPANPDAYLFWRELQGVVTREQESDLQLEVREGSPPSLWVFPSPRVARKLSLVVDKVREVAELTRKDVEGIVSWAVGECLIYRGRKRSKSVTQIPTATGRLILDDGHKFREEGEEAKCKQERKWGAGATVAEAG